MIEINALRTNFRKESFMQLNLFKSGLFFTFFSCFIMIFQLQAAATLPNINEETQHTSGLTAQATLTKDTLNQIVRDEKGRFLIEANIYQNSKLTSLPIARYYLEETCSSMILNSTFDSVTIKASINHFNDNDNLWADVLRINKESNELAYCKLERVQN